MMEVLFRGRMIDGTNRWVEGAYCSHIYDIYEDVSVYRPHIITVKNECKRIFVDVQTVGQYIGLKDCRGNRIFEGDIVHVSAPNNFFFTGAVDFVDGSFMLRDVEDSGALEVMWYNPESMEVVGNIYDSDGGEVE